VDFEEGQILGVTARDLLKGSFIYFFKFFFFYLFINNDLFIGVIKKVKAKEELKERFGPPNYPPPPVASDAPLTQQLLWTYIQSFVKPSTFSFFLKIKRIETIKEERGSRRRGEAEGERD
jgi:hypothetical protein